MCPLSRDDVERLLDEGRHENGELDLSGHDLSGADLSGLTLDRVIFGRRDGDRVTRLDRVNLRGARLSDCSFTRCDLADVDLRGATLEACDLRYVTTTRTTFADALLRDCDLYRAFLGAGTVFRPEELRRVSFTNAWLQGATGLTREQVPDSALVQLDETAYREFLERTLDDRPEEDTAGAMAGRLREAADFYRTLSGYWTANGSYGDAGWAYGRSQVLERRHASPFGPSRRRSLPRWIGLLIAEWISGYGMRPGRVLATFAVVALLPGVFYAAVGGVRDGDQATRSFGDCILFSAGQLVNSVPDRLTTNSELLEWIGFGQTLVGIALAGLLGFVLGYVIRSN